MAPEDPIADGYGSSGPPDPTIWMRALRYFTRGAGRRRVEEGDIFLAFDHEVENLENLQFARRESPPPRARRR